MSGDRIQRPDEASRRSVWSDRRGAVFAEYVIVFGAVGVIFALAAAAISKSVALAFAYKVLFLSTDAIQ